MSSIKWTKAFSESIHKSFLICQKNSHVEKGVQEKGLPFFSFKANDYISPGAVLKLRKILKKEKVEAVFLHRLTDLWLVVPATCGLNIKIFGFARIFLKNNPKNDLAHKCLYSYMDKLIALSFVQKKKLLELLPIKEEQVAVIPNGIPTDRFAPGEKSLSIRKELGANEGQLLIGLVGRLDKQKGQLETVRALKHLESEFPNAVVSLIGAETEGQNDYTGKVSEEIKKLGLSDKVHMVGYRSDMPEVLKALDIFTMPSYEENFANILLEAMASGCACVATNSGGTPEILDYGKYGVLVEPRKHEPLAGGLREFLESEEKRVDFGKRASARAQELYDIKVVFQQVEALL